MLKCYGNEISLVLLFAKNIYISIQIDKSENRLNNFTSDITHFHGLNYKFSLVTLNIFTSDITHFHQ